MCPLSALEQLSSGQATFNPSESTTPSCVPTEPISLGAYTHVRTRLHPSILAHSLRTFLHAKTLSAAENTPWHTPLGLPLLFIACLFHDMGTSPSCDGPQRFEIEGADAASAFLNTRSPDIAPDDVREVWTAIALHTSPGIAERITVLARIVRLAVLVDFKVPHPDARVDAKDIEHAERAFPRGEIEKVLGDAVAEQAESAQEPQRKAPPATWPGVLLQARRENPGWTGVNKAF
ncbi:hypothetical protein CONPUDRAFT_131847 [Coniophora puteana RWD-64-598 SS2]|uniref:HD/PDEase domain-containing protein n=1 Tax=Coniophora puteana (strain RWD-64-598) TaxID=741705 RepID=A0A5M3M8P2_CONPW|nr:uncharacterized protein CONPUDRAFT_131847 [Coniophora puteana RWD-64-598 SS2]EIW75618.1 hypothetical protein CONPUDRAFT_131847 [Coniophora puteana RWD-64-598 SS2]